MRCDDGITSGGAQEGLYKKTTEVFLDQGTGTILGSGGDFVGGCDVGGGGEDHFFITRFV